MPTCHVQPSIDPKTWAVTNVVSHIATKNAVVIDPLLADDSKPGHTDMRAADALLAYIRSENLAVIPLNAWSRRKSPDA